MKCSCHRAIRGIVCQCPGVLVPFSLAIWQYARTRAAANRCHLLEGMTMTWVVICSYCLPLTDCLIWPADRYRIFSPLFLLNWQVCFVFHIYQAFFILYFFQIIFMLSNPPLKTELTRKQRWVSQSSSQTQSQFYLSHITANQCGHSVGNCHFSNFKVWKI